MFVWMHINDESKGPEITQRILAAYRFGREPPASRPLVIETIE